MHMQDFYPINFDLQLYCVSFFTLVFFINIYKLLLFLLFKKMTIHNKNKGLCFFDLGFWWNQD